MKNFILAAISVIALSSGAIASDLPTSKSPPVPVYGQIPFSWTGLYVGATVGAAGLATNYTLNYEGDFAKGYGGGVIAGMTLGYNYQISQIVVGVEGDFSFATAGNSASGNGLPTATTGMHDFGTARARVGVAVDSALLYVTGGLAFADLSSTSVDYYVNDPYYNASSSGTSTGWTIGGGVEYPLSSHVTLKAEALYADFGTKKAADQDGYVHSFDTTATIGRVGMNYKF